MKHNLLSYLKATFLLTAFVLSHSGYATNVTSDNTAQALTNNSKKKVYTFELTLWSPEQLASVEAKPVEVGGNYFYQYNPEAIVIDEAQDNRMIEFKFHPSLGNRYQFRWLTADHPQYVTLKKMKQHRMKVKLNDGPIADDIYFEVWVYDTLTGEVFMCDPQIQNKGKD